MKFLGSRGIAAASTIGIVVRRLERENYLRIATITHFRALFASVADRRHADTPLHGAGMRIARFAR
jgi:hypothetical protein